MPIYAYKCESCGLTKDVLQKMSDAPLTECPACHAPTFKKQLTAAGFQLKGSGWYVTDFRDGRSGAAAGADGSKTDAAPTGGTESKPDSAPATNAAPAPAPVAKKETATVATPSTPSSSDSKK